MPGNFQQEIIAPPLAQPGVESRTISVGSGYVITVKQVLTADAVIGRFGWIDDANPEGFVQVKGANTILAGVVRRSNKEVFPFADLTSYVVPVDQFADLFNRGAVWVTVEEFVSGTTTTYGQNVWVRDTDGAVALGVNEMTPEAGYSKSNYKVLTPGVAVNGLIEISNVDLIDG